MAAQSDHVNIYRRHTDFNLYGTRRSSSDGPLQVALEDCPGALAETLYDRTAMTSRTGVMTRFTARL